MLKLAEWAEYAGQNSKTLKTEQTRLIGLLVAKITLFLAL